ncbi:S8 family serine peptidase [Gottfriedia acidiceleris]|uniref:S8 family serine peptidase n=1 Tax=Gottfriedia acidiceleris TaxID=371036 RepID=UPI003D226586
MKKKKINNLALLGLSATLALSSQLPTVSHAVSKDSDNQRPTLSQSEKVVSTVKKNNKSAGAFDVGQKQFSENQLVIRYTSPITESEHAKSGGRLIKRISSLGYDVIEVKNVGELEKVVQAYAKLPKVTSISKSALFKRLGTVDLKTSEMYHLKNLNVEKAQKLAGKNKIRVGVIDTGIDTKHPELVNKVVANKNAMNPIKKGIPDSHGTHVSGIIAAEKNNGIGGYGIAPNSQIISIDVFNKSDFGTDYVIAEGILEAIKQKVDVINMSLGSYSPSPIVRDAVKKAIDKGIVIVAAAGNSGVENIEYPASYDGVISVGATDKNNKITKFSTYGPSVDVTAPGDNIYSTVYSPDKGSTFVHMSGTSMAAPMVTGAVSLLLSKYPKLTPYQVNYILTQTAKDLGEKGYDAKYGYGMIDLVKLLSFDPKKIPAQSVIKDDQILDKAKPLTLSSETSVTGALQKIEQIDYYKFDVEKNQNIQISLQGASQYDLKYELQFYPEGARKPEYTLEVNDRKAGKAEGSYFKAPKKGTIVIALKDSFGQYNEDGKSTYSLSVSRKDLLHDDGNTLERPFVIDSLPYKTSLSNYYTDELTTSLASRQEDPIPGDSDFYRFKVPGNIGDPEKVLKFHVSAVEGIDPSFRLHMVNKVVNEDGTTSESINVVDQFKVKGYGESKTASMTALPGMEYIFEVTNKPLLSEYDQLIGKEIDFTRSYTSQKPYQVDIDIKDISQDEDNFRQVGKVSVNMESKENGINKFKEIYDKFTNMDYQYHKGTSYFDLIKDKAIPLELDKAQKGYFQYRGDEDWFKFTPKDNSVFEMKFTNKEGYNVPIALVHKYSDRINDLDSIYSSLDTNSVDGTGLKGNNSFNIGLKKGETYYILLNDSSYRSSFDPYEFKISTAFKNTNDNFEHNDTFETAKKITTKPIVSNLSSIGDIDTFYFKPNKTSIYSAIEQPGSLPIKYNSAHTELKRELDSVFFIYEDTNGNQKLEEKEKENVSIVDFSYDNQPEISSFRAKKGSGYFFKIQNYFDRETNLTPYTFTVKEVVTKDEDAGSIVKNNVPTKPISLKFQSGKFSNVGFINMTNNIGDADYYKLVQKSDGNKTIKLEVPFDLDGVVTVYNSKGKQVAFSDFYSNGDNEIFNVNLKKGNYYIKVEDFNGNASAMPYKLIIN